MRALAVAVPLITALAPLAFAFNPAAGDFTRADPTHIRVLTYNVLGNFISDPSTDDEFTRLLTALQPDVIALQEMDSPLTVTAIRNRLQAILGGTWSVNRGLSDGFNRNALCSRFPQSLQIQDTEPDAGIRGVTAALIDLPTAQDLYVMAVHMKSGGAVDDHRQRQLEADALISWQRDARTPGGLITLPVNTPMLVVGDTNFGFEGEGDTQPYHGSRTLTDGDIFDEGVFGPDAPPDWDSTPATDAAPYDHTNAESHTFSSSTPIPQSRLDRFIYTDSVIRPAHRFIVNTRTLSPQSLATAGLHAGDTDESAGGASDHLPCVVDFALGADTRPLPRVLINEFSYDDPGADDRSFVEMINVGGQEMNLQAPVSHRLLRSNVGLPTTPPAAENESFNYALRGIIPPGGVFVLWDAEGDSAALRPVLESNLPPLQRQDHSLFNLSDSANCGLALVVEFPIDRTEYADAVLDAYLYEGTNLNSPHHFLTDSANGLLITLLGEQSSGVELSSDSHTHSRNRGDGTANSFSGWTIPDVATPGAHNASPPPGLAHGILWH